MEAGAAFAVLIAWLIGVAVALWLSVFILRAGLEPVRLQLQRIADEIEARNDLDADDEGPA